MTNHYLVKVHPVEININADLGEEAGQDDQLMPFLSSCNIACGGHIGDEESISTTIQLAKRYNVKIGAHPSYPDRINFGRKRPEISDKELVDSLVEQLDLFFSIAIREGVDVSHVKAHGALYNDAARDQHSAELFIEALKNIGKKVKIYTLNNSKLHHLALPQFSVIHEAFIDRAYNDDLSLVSRDQLQALHKSKEKAWKQLHEMYFLGEVTSISGKKVDIKADTFCIHGDHPEALAILKHIREQLLKNQSL